MQNLSEFIDQDNSTLDLHTAELHRQLGVVSLMKLQEFARYLRNNPEIANEIQYLTLPNFEQGITKDDLMEGLRQVLALLPNIDQIGLEDTRIDFLPPLDWTKIQYCLCKDSSLSAESAIALFNTLNWPEMRYFEFSTSNQEPNTLYLDALFEGLKKSTRIEHLMLGRLSLNSEQLIAFLELIDTRTIDSLELSDNNFGNLFAGELNENTKKLWEKFAEIIENCKVKKLGLNADNIHPSQIVYFLSVLSGKKNIALRKIDYTYNPNLEKQALKDIAASLSTLSIQELNLEESINVEGDVLEEVFSGVNSLNDKPFKESQLFLVAVNNRKVRNKSEHRIPTEIWFTIFNDFHNIGEEKPFVPSGISY